MAAVTKEWIHVIGRHDALISVRGDEALNYHAYFSSLYMAAKAGYRTAGKERDNFRTLRFRRVVIDVFGRPVEEDLEPADKECYTACIKHLISAQIEAGVWHTPTQLVSPLSWLASRMIAASRMTAGHISLPFAT